MKNALKLDVGLGVKFVCMKAGTTEDHVNIDSFSVNASTVENLCITVFPCISCWLRGNWLLKYDDCCTMNGSAVSIHYI